MSRLIGLKEFYDLFSGSGMVVGEEMYGRFERYAELLCEWNEKMNLTAITDPEGIAVKHFFDSVYPFTIEPPPENCSLIDVGTGAGFPAIPLKIYRNDIRITLLDSLNKRVGFLQTVSDELGLNAKCVHGRAEESARDTMREAFNAASARAVANLRELCEYCLPFVKVGGSFYALKGRDVGAELNDAKNAVRVLGGEVGRVERYALPNGDERTLIVIRKVKSTDGKYPRNAGQMKKKPL